MTICKKCGKKSRFASVSAGGLCQECSEAEPRHETETNDRAAHDPSEQISSDDIRVPTSPLDPPVISDAQLRMLIKRYEDAYTVAKVTVAFGSGVQMAGKAIGVVLALLAFALASQTRGSEATVLGIVGVVFAALIGGLIYILGILISAIGQTLTASLDTATHTSPFLAHHQRLRIISLS